MQQSGLLLCDTVTEVASSLASSQAKTWPWLLGHWLGNRQDNNNNNDFHNYPGAQCHYTVVQLTVRINSTGPGRRRPRRGVADGASPVSERHPQVKATAPNADEALPIRAAWGFERARRHQLSLPVDVSSRVASRPDSPREAGAQGRRRPRRRHSARHTAVRGKRSGRAIAIQGGGARSGDGGGVAGQE